MNVDTSRAGTCIGTSGWHYEHWRGAFYPRDLKKDRQLAYYAARLNCVEVNNTFYQLPAKETVVSWLQRVPDAFTFALKASRYITHMKKLKDPEQSLKAFLETASAFGRQAGPLLFQLPPRWKCNPDRLNAFLQVLPSRHRCALEFRDTSWINDSVLSLLKERNAAFCIYELDGYLSPKEVTADFVYIRLHGPGAAYQGKYDTPTLAGWAGAVSAWREKGLDVHVCFDNDQEGFAVQNAQELRAMLAKGGGHA